MIIDEIVNKIIKTLSKINWKNECDIREVKNYLKKIFKSQIDDYKYPRIGVSVILEKNDKVLLMKRKNSIGDGTWGFPGGKLNKHETIKNCAIREVKEELNLDIFNLKIQQKITEDYFTDDNKHFITLYVKSEFIGEPSIMEKDKCDDIKWYKWDNLPEKIFLPLKNFL